MDADRRYIPGKPDRCPACGRRDIRPSVHRGMVDSLMRAFSFVPYRCRACERRFYRRISTVEVEEAEVNGETGSTGSPVEKV